MSRLLVMPVVFIFTGILCAGHGWAIPLLILCIFFWTLLLYRWQSGQSTLLLALQKWFHERSIPNIRSTKQSPSRIRAEQKNPRASYALFRVILPVFFLLLGFLRQEWTLHQINTSFQPWAEQKIKVTGTLLAPPQKVGDTVSCLVKVNTIDGAPFSLSSTHLKMVWYGQTDALQANYGDMMNFAGTLRLPEGRRNPGGFDAAGYLAARHIFGQVNLSEAPVPQNRNDGNFLFATGFRLKAAAIGQLHRWLPATEASVMAGMLLGDTDALDRDLKTSFRITGLSHIMAVSGANVAFILLPLLWLFKRLGLNRRLASAVSIPFLCMYVLMTGFEASIVRAALMAACMLLGQLLWRKNDALTSLSLACLLMLSCNSQWFFDAGFQLSFLATLSIALFYERIKLHIPKKVPGVVKDTLAGTLAAQVGVFPVLLSTFHTLSLLSLPANLIVVPFTGIITFLGALGLSIAIPIPAAGLFLGKILSFLLSALIRFIQAAADIPGAERIVASPPWLLVLLYVFWLMYFRYGYVCFVREKRIVVTVGALALSILVMLVVMLPDKRLHVYVADVGQGDGMLLKTPAGAAIVIDGGGSAADKEGSRAGEKVMLPLLLSVGVIQPDLLVSTHGHADHILGLISLEEQMGAKAISLSGREPVTGATATYLDLAKEKQMGIQKVQAGDVVWVEKDFVLKVLSPTSEWSPPDNDGNKTALVLLLQYKDFSMLFMADAGEEAEALLLQSDQLPKLDVLKVGHHGSATATSTAFLDRIQPAVGVVSVGRNRYGHPAKDTLKRLSAAAVTVHTTRSDGAFVLKTDGRAYSWYPFVVERVSLFD